MLESSKVYNVFYIHQFDHKIQEELNCQFLMQQSKAHQEKY
jgi:hypothetical protein